jgi:hypothetical protein
MLEVQANNVIQGSDGPIIGRTQQQSYTQYWQLHCGCFIVDANVHQSRLMFLPLELSSKESEAGEAYISV